MEQANLIRFYDRRPEPLSLKIGNVHENLCESIRFVLPEDYAQASAFLHLQIGSFADVIRLDQTRTFTPTRTHTQLPGQWTAYLELIEQDDVVWRSDLMHLYVGDLPNDGPAIEQQYPTAVEEALRAADTLSGMGARAETLDPGSAATVTFEQGEDGSRVIVYGIPKGDKGEMPVKGVDYFTAADKAAIVQDVLDALPEAEGVSY